MSESKTTARKTTAAAWKKAALHEDITLPSGTKVDIKLPNIPKLIEAGEIPSALVQAAAEAAAEGGTRNLTIGEELMKNHADFTRKIIPRTLVTPEVTEEEVGDLPYEDQEFLVELATRNRDFDAVGKHIGGLHTQDEFRRFRGLPIGNEGLADL